MKLAAPYPVAEDRQQKIDEYNITFDVDTQKFENLIAWLRKPQVKEKRVNLEMISKDKKTISLQDLSLINDLHNKVYIRLKPSQSGVISEYKECKIKFFFDYTFGINSFCRLQEAINRGSTDVYIMEDLCYRLPQIRKICNEHNVNLRFIVNLIPSFIWDKGNDLTSTYYVPENMEELEKYYDVMEFELFNSWNRFDTLYKIWFEDREWKEDLKFINFELEQSIPGDSFPKELCEYKMTCQHRCFERLSSCHKCEQYIHLAHRMHDNGMIYTAQKWVKGDKDEPIENILNDI